MQNTYIQKSIISWKRVPSPQQRCSSALGSVQSKSQDPASFPLWKCCFLLGSTLLIRSDETHFLSCRSKGKHSETKLVQNKTKMHVKEQSYHILPNSMQ